MTTQALAPGVTYLYSVTGINLKPGSVVIVNFLRFPSTQGEVIGLVGADGTFSFTSSPSDCLLGNIVIEGIAPDDTAVVSEEHTGASCTEYPS